LTCPVRTDLAQLGQDELCRIAHRTNRLNQFWDEATPESVHPLKTISLGFHFLEEGERVDLLANIPGTTIIIIHAHKKCRKLFSWDITSAGPISVEEGIPLELKKNFTPTPE